MKKVLFAIPSLGNGGAERVLVTLLNNLDQKKYNITLFSLFDEGTNREYLSQNIHYKYYFKRLFRGNIHLLKLLHPKILYRMMIKDEYDIVISYLEGPTTRIISGCSSQNTKLLNWVHTEVNNSKEIVKSYRSLREMINVYNKYTSTIFVSNSALSTFKKRLRNINGNMLVKYNTVDTNLILERSKEKIEDLEFESTKINLISVGRFTKVKGYIRLLKIMKWLIDENLNVHLYLIGKGELEVKYREIIDKYRLNEYVTILGYKDNPYKYVKGCDLFVCSSYQEGYSTAVTESLIVGTPVITTLCSGMEEMLGSNNEYGVITENNDEALYQGIKQMVMDKSVINYYKKKATERGRIFSTTKTVKAIEELLDSI